MYASLRKKMDPHPSLRCSLSRWPLPQQHEEAHLLLPVQQGSFQDLKQKDHLVQCT